MAGMNKLMSMSPKRLVVMFVLSLVVSGLCFMAPALAQNINIDLGAPQGGSATGQVLRMVVLLTVLSLAPSILMMVTSFTRIIVVFSMLRSAMGIQQTPPNSVLISLALFLTMFIMQPTFEKAYNDGILPLIEERIDEKAALALTAAPFHEFMRGQVRVEDVELFMELSKTPEVDEAEDLPYRVLVPAFMISELRRAFEIGFLVFIPFLIIDMMVASTLMSMGMMMLPPVLISLPFKIIFFVLIDGWHMLSESLVKSFG
jgi:flagellar biosynthetic protein FliP